MVSMASELHQERAITRVLRPYTRLPHPSTWATTDKGPYHQALPEALAGIVRQFTAAALDLGQMGFDDGERYQAFRRQIFDNRDALLAQLDGWLRFWGVVDPNGQVRAAVRAALEADDAAGDALS
jgi:hypothetical protein